MSLTPAQILAALGTAQARLVAPVLDGTYAGGSAATIAATLFMLAGDLATFEERRRREVAVMAGLLRRDGSHAELLAALDARLTAIDGDPAHRDETIAILDVLVEMTTAAVLRMPANT